MARRKAQARGKNAGAATDGSPVDQHTKNEQAKHE